MRHPALLAGALLLAVASSALATDPSGPKIVDTLHNLSVSGPGTIKATTETQVCVFCHTPHNSNPSGPLWNHQLSSGVTYVMYTSSTLVAYTSQATAPQPNGSTRLCLSCHDGTVALGAIVNGSGPIALQGGVTQLTPSYAGYVGTDLSHTHPLSFTVTDQLIATKNANDPSMSLNSLSAMESDPTVHLDGQQRVQCTACHDPHSDANYATSGVHFYQKPQRADPCSVCHSSPAQDQGPHYQPAALTKALSTSQSSSTATSRSSMLMASGGARAPGVLDAAPGGAGGRSLAHGNLATLPQSCMSCHASHAPNEGQHSLLLARDEEACYRCHGPERAQEQRAGRLAPGTKPVDLMVEFQKPSHHPIEFPGDHKPNERLPETDPNARRHVLCVDCHDAHGTLAVQPAAAGTELRPSSTRRFATEAQMCFLCHGPAANRPANQPDASRQFASTSYHPVLAPGRAVRVPSLVPPLTASSVIACTDCHGNDNPLGPAGPHGSLFAPLLLRRYERTDGQPESPARYDLCYRCHDRNSILSDASFPYHRMHVIDQRTACYVCHSAHGSDNPGLVQLDTTVVQPNARGMRAFTSLGTGGGQCALLCHGYDHDPESYCGPGVPCGTTQRSRRQIIQGSLKPVPAAESLFPGWPGQ